MVNSHMTNVLYLSLDSPTYLVFTYCVEFSGMTRNTRKWLATRLPGGRLQLLDTDNCYRILQWAAITASSPADCRLPGPLSASQRGTPVQNISSSSTLLVRTDSSFSAGESMGNVNVYQKEWGGGGVSLFSLSCPSPFAKMNRQNKLERTEYEVK